MAPPHRGHGIISNIPVHDHRISPVQGAAIRPASRCGRSARARSEDSHRRHRDPITGLFFIRRAFHGKPLPPITGGHFVETTTAYPFAVTLTFYSLFLYSALLAPLHHSPLPPCSRWSPTATSYRFSTCSVFPAAAVLPVRGT